ncbi:hypothetical protein QL189_19805 [Cronobacter turicensis]|uniref:hypothetical protein n=1 Tax=Cronobacter turicensis TaxID=413502 RepID=UPI0024A842AC|nr:hypothetical protein [Cronobacter turicensis]EKM0439327.1 hypothetical protein [Cronobacter turicensis]ELY4323843.1 hypothetical protein [Cronobacter turicensis]ELY5944000.1 hypothetical protein [Cronobacter turicensis]ELY5965365.1 hypothetical protein [Cronobacter turicensis]MDI6419629.1 hypothetical protein [Cronobacter turicensis]
MSIDDISNSIEDAMKQNLDILIDKGTVGKYQISGMSDGIEYVAGFKNGRIGKFYPK